LSNNEAFFGGGLGDKLWDGLKRIGIAVGHEGKWFFFVVLSAEALIILIIPSHVLKHQY
jgi:hypothetical protein